LRRPWEDRFLLQGGVDEVFLLNDAETIVLEGLTSNIMVIDSHNRTITTSPCSAGLLDGHARRLVLQYAKSLGYTLYERPLQLTDAPAWSEVVVTSSLRILVPVERIVAPPRLVGETAVVVWSRSHDHHGGGRSIYHAILQGEFKSTTREEFLNE
jgi:branched-subunit amino acid aminotransferase/4-amino-4-deoxychorismate lyase